METELDIEKEEDNMNFEIFFVILLGLVIGSFLNVCIYRIPRNEYITFPPSHCMNCETRLKKWHLIPVFSYMFLKGRCAYCGSKISSRYVVVEVLTSILFLIIFFRYGLTCEFLIYAFLVSLLIVMTFIDIDYMIIPNQIVILGLIAGFGLIIYNYWYPMDIYLDDYWWNPLLGVLVGSGFLVLVSILGLLVYKSNEVMGMGDVKILAPIGIFLGWRMTIVALYVSVITAGIVSIILIALGNKERKSKLVFGPFIALGTYIAIIFGQELLDWWIVYVIG